MPSQILPGRQFDRSLRQDQKFLPSVFIIVPPIAVVLEKPPAHVDPVILINGYVTAVKERVEVRLQKQSVIDRVRSFRSIWFDMRSLQDRKGLFSSDRAAAMISICDDNAESPLAETMFCHVFAIPLSRITYFDRRLAVRRLVNP